MEVIALVVSVAAFAVSVLNSWYTRRSANAAERSAAAAERSAAAAVRSVEHQIEREKPKGRASSLSDGDSVVVANTGAVPFTVVEVGLGSLPFSCGLGAGNMPDRSAVRDVPAGSSALFRRPFDFCGSGPAYAVLASGAVLREDAPDGEQ